MRQLLARITAKSPPPVRSSPDGLPSGSPPASTIDVSPGQSSSRACLKDDRDPSDKRRRFSSFPCYVCGHIFSKRKRLQKHALTHGSSSDSPRRVNADHTQDLPPDPPAESPVCHHTRARIAAGRACASISAPPTTPGTTYAEILADSSNPLPVPSPLQSRPVSPLPSDVSPALLPATTMCSPRSDSVKPGHVPQSLSGQHPAAAPSLDSSVSTDDVPAAIRPPDVLPSLPDVPMITERPADVPPSAVFPETTCRKDRTVHLVFPVSDTLHCTETSCIRTFHARQWSQLRHSLCRHLH
ncbi:hypothetical protein X975_09690, partial [Stegodyphus mimosarum]